MELGTECVELLLVGRAESAPEDVSCAVREQDDDLAAGGNLELAAEEILIEIERHDAGPEVRIRKVTAQSGVVPPAVEGILLGGDGQEVVTEVVMEATEGLGRRDPVVHFGCVSGVEGDEQKVAVCAEGSGECDFCLCQVVGGDGGEMYGR